MCEVVRKRKSSDSNFEASSSKATRKVSSMATLHSRGSPAPSTTSHDFVMDMVSVPSSSQVSGVMDVRPPFEEDDEVISAFDAMDFSMMKNDIPTAIVRSRRLREMYLASRKKGGSWKP